jgi:hypothetical protein
MSNEELVAFLRKNVISVACVVVSILIGLLLYYRNDKLPDAEKVLADRAKQGELLAANIEDSADLKEQHAALVESNNAISDRMIHVAQLAENYQYFYRLESETGTKLSDPRQVPWNAPAKTAAKTNFIAIGFTLSAQGDYAQLMDLLRKLESGDHYCRITACSLRPLATDVRGGPMLMSLSLELMGVQ